MDIKMKVPGRNSLFGGERPIGSADRQRLRGLEDRKPVDTQDRAAVRRHLPGAQTWQVRDCREVLAGCVLQEEPAILVLKVDLHRARDTCNKRDFTNTETTNSLIS